MYEQVNTMLEKNCFDKTSIDLILKTLNNEYPEDWLIKMNILELANKNNEPIDGLLNEISLLIDETELGQVIKRGLNLII